MTLEQAYFISQIFAAIGLMASIVFLGLQVRQNSAMLGRLMNEDYRNNQISHYDEISKNREFAEFHMKIGKDYDSLDDIDKHRARYLALKNVRAMIQSIQARIEGFVSDADWNDLKQRIRAGSRRRKATQLAWEEIKSNYPKQVQDIWEEISQS